MPSPRPCRVCGEYFTPAFKDTVTLCPKSKCRGRDRRNRLGIKPREPVVKDGKKRCNKCGRNLPVSRFPARSNRKSGIQSACGECLRKQASDYSKSDAGKHARLARKYGVSLEWYERQLKAQGGKCAICGKRENGGRDGLCVDHDHRSGKARGLLCWHCNAAIGKLGDSVPTLERAARYLRKYG